MGYRFGLLDILGGECPTCPVMAPDSAVSRVSRVNRHDIRVSTDMGTDTSTDRVLLSLRQAEIPANGFILPALKMGVIRRLLASGGLYFSFL